MNGRAHAVLLFVILCLLPLTALADIESGLTWLTAQQRVDGALAGPQEQVVPFQATAEAIDTLATLDALARIDAPAALDYLDADPYRDTEWLARRIIARAQLGEPVTDLIDQLRTHRGRDGGFGGEAGHQSTLLGTAWALKAFAAAGLHSDPLTSQAVGWLLGKQQASGRWPAGEDDTGLYLTTQATTALWHYRHTYALGDSLERARQWLLDQRQGGGGWSDTQETANALLAVLPGLADTHAVESDIDTIESAQGNDGSWAQRTQLSALALRVLRRAAVPSPNPDLASVHGRLITSDTNVPIEGAEVRLPDLAIETLTDNSGRFYFDSISAGTYRIEFWVSSGLRLSGEFVVERGRDLDLGDFMLRATPNPLQVDAVFGIATIRNVDGQVMPASGALIEVRREGVASSAKKAQADEQGRFRISGWATGWTGGKLLITASLTGYSDVLGEIGLAEGGQAYLFNPQFQSAGSAPGARLEVEVSDAETGTPLSGAHIDLSGENNAHLITNGSGVAVFEALDEGATHVLVAKEGYSAVRVDVDVLAGQNYLFPVALAPRQAVNGSVSGRIVDASDDTPVSGALIELTGGLQQVSDAGGEFEFLGLEPGTYSLSISASGYVELTGTFELGERSEVELGDVALSRNADTETITLSGTARFRNGLTEYPAAGATIQVGDLSAQTGLDGRYVLENIPVESFVAEAHYIGYPSISMPVDGQAGAQVLFSPVFAHLEVAQGASLVVSVRDAATEAVLVGARVQLSGANSHQSRTDAAGTAELVDLVKGRTYVTTTMAGYGASQIQASVTDGERVNLSVTLSKVAHLNPTDATFAMPENYNGRASESLFIYGEPGIRGKVSNRAGFSGDFELPSSGVSLVPLPIAHQLRAGGRIENYAFRVVADGPVSIEWLSRLNMSSDATAISDLGGLGTEYRALSYGAPKTMSQVVVAAPYDGTLVTVTPSEAVLNGGSMAAAGVPFTVELKAGQAVMYIPAQGLDLSGTHVLSNKPVAVFGGNQCGLVPADAAGACDFLVSQLPSVDRFSRRVIVGETAHTGSGGNLLRVLSASDGNIVSLNGVPLVTLNAGEFHEVETLRGGGVIEAAEPVLVVQYLKSQSEIKPFDGDPSMSHVPGADYWLSRYVVATPIGDDAFADNYLHIVAPKSAIDSIVVNGVGVDSSQFQDVGASEYGYANIPVDEGLHTVEADVDFLAMLSGFSTFDSYLTLAATAYSHGASRPLPVQGDIDLAANGLEYAAGSDVVFSLLATNRSERRHEMSASLRIEDSHGRPVAVLEPHELGIVEGGATASAQRTWNTGILMAGAYTVFTELLSVQGETVATDEVSFRILAGDGSRPTEALHLSTDKPQYTLGEPVTWNARIDNLAGNRILRRAQVALAVTDASAATVAERLIDLPEIQPHGQLTLEEILATLSAPGTYTLRAELRIDGEPVTADSTTIQVVAASVLRTVLSGQTTLGRAEAPVGEGIARSDSVHNIGEAPLTDLRVARVLADDTSGEEIARSEATVTLAPGAATDWSDTLQTDGLTEGDYLALLLVREGETWLVIDHAELTLTAAEGGGPGDPDPEDPDPEDPDPEDPEPEEPEPVAIPVLGGGALIGLLLALMLTAAVMHRRGPRHTPTRATGR